MKEKDVAKTLQSEGHAIKFSLVRMICYRRANGLPFEFGKDWGAFKRNKSGFVQTHRGWTRKHFDKDEKELPPPQ